MAHENAKRGGGAKGEEKKKKTSTSAAEHGGLQKQKKKTSKTSITPQIDKTEKERGGGGWGGGWGVEKSLSLIARKSKRKKCLESWVCVCLLHTRGDQSRTGKGSVMCGMCCVSRGGCLVREGKGRG